MPLLSTAGNGAYNPALLRQCRVFSTCTTPMPTGRSTSGWMVNHWNARRSQCTLVWPWTDHWRTTTTSWKLRRRFGRGTTSSAGWLARRGVHRRRHSGRLPWHCVFQWQSIAHRSGVVVPTLTWSTSSWTRRWGRSREPCVPLHYRGSQSSVTSFQPAFAARRQSPGWSGRFRQIRISHLSRTYSTLQEYVFCPGTLCGWRYLALSSLPCPPGKKIGRIKISGTVSLSRTHRFALLGLIWCAQIGSHSTATALVMAGVRRASTSGASRTIHSAPVAASRRCPTLSTSVRWRNSTVASGLSTALTAKQLSGFAREAHAKKKTTHSLGRAFPTWYHPVDIFIMNKLKILHSMLRKFSIILRLPWDTEYFRKNGRARSVVMIQYGILLWTTAMNKPDAQIVEQFVSSNSWTNLSVCRKVMRSFREILLHRDQNDRYPTRELSQTYAAVLKKM